MKPCQERDSYVIPVYPELVFIVHEGCVGKYAVFLGGFTCSSVKYAMLT